MAWIKLLEALAVAGIGEKRLLDLLLAGDVPIRFRNPNGTTQPVRPEQLARAVIDWANSRIESTPGPLGFRGSVEVDRERLLANMSDTARPPLRRGRKPTWDWPQFAVELAARVYEHGLPENPAQMVEEMLQWFVDNFGDHPDKDNLRKCINDLYARLGRR